MKNRGTIGIRLFLSVFIFFASFCLSYSYPGGKVHYHYRDISDRGIADIDLTLDENQNGCMLTCKNSDEISESMDDASLSNIEWSLTKLKEHTVLKVKREGDLLLINGIFKGKEIHDKKTIDESPWYQATSLSLRNFVSSSDQERMFWVLRSDNLCPLKFNAIKEVTESIRVEDRCYDALRIAMRPVGLKSIFWKGEYWFSIDDGCLLKFTGPTSLPGSSVSEIIFVSEEKIK